MRRVGQRPGDIRVRRGRRRTAIIDVVVQRQRQLRPRLWMVPTAFAALIALGALLLALPISSESREWTSGWDALFTSASAICVTGLARVDTADHWSSFGEVVIAVLIQAGGLGVTMYAGALLLILGRRFGLRERQFFGIELADVSVRDIRVLLRRVMIFVVAVEGATFALLLPWSIAEDGLAGGTWRAAFHAISAFNNAGFDLMGGGRGFSGQVDDAYPLLVMGVSAFLGSLSFITVFNLRRAPRLWSLDTRLVAYGMVALLLVGMLVFLGEIGSGRVLDGQGVPSTLANAFFLSVNRTTGMASVDMALLQDSTTAALLVLMFIGGASTSTAGGIKMGAFMVSVVVVVASLRGHHRAQAFGREIPQVIVLRAIAITMVGFATHVVGTWLLEVTESDVEFLPLLFEAMSALANVGWSQGVTTQLSDAGAMILVALMFVGRLGPLLVALSVPDRPEDVIRYPEASVRIG
ncbi:MAG: Trk family potassium uptake protein [Chloroflexi bacterium]|nr:Trk family potassium uptake protein [Chloroflexota bacterium]